MASAFIDIRPAHPYLGATEGPTMKTTIASLFAASVLAVTAASAAPPAPAPATAAEAVTQLVEKVCRPAADSQTSPANFAEAAGLKAEPAAPPNLPMGIAGLSTWRAPSPEGRLYVMSGVFPESTTPSTCVVALYDTPGAPIHKAVNDYVLGLKRGFALNPAYDITTGGQHLVRYDRRAGDTLHSVIVMDALDPKPGQPSEVFAAFVVDYGWMLHPGKSHP